VWVCRGLADRRARLEAIEHRLSHSTLRREDREALGRILPVLGATFGGDLFLASECITHHAPGLRLVLAGMNARRLGRLLRGGAGVAVDGYMVSASGTEAGAVIWCVYRVP
jgi:hypothetical protein